MIDLHTHTRISDGYSTGQELILQANKLGIKYLSITNHDTTLGLKDAVEFGKKHNVEIIPGIEISAYDFKNDKKVHVLGYYIDYEKDDLNQFCSIIIKKRHQNCIKMIETLQKASYKITLEEIMEIAKHSTGIFKQHIMHGLINKGYCASICCDLYNYLFSSGKKDKTKGIAYIKPTYVDAKEAVHAIIESNGIPVLAHPALNDNYDAIPELVDAGLTGLELKHSRQTAEDEKKILEYTNKYNLMTTGGSDYHGFYGESCEILGNNNPGIDCIYTLKKIKHLNTILIH